MTRLNHGVTAGQEWSDLDERQQGRVVRVDHVHGMFAYCTVVRSRFAAKRNSAGSRVTIRLDRFWPMSRGFGLRYPESGAGAA